MQVSAGQMFGVLRITNPEVYKGRYRYAVTVCTNCGTSKSIRVADLSKGQQCKCLTRGRRRGAYRKRG